MVAVISGFICGFQKKNWTHGQLFVVLLSVILIILNTLFMNIADPRYNFIVYPKFGFAAYPLLIMTFVLCLSKLRNKIRAALFLIWVMVAVFGLWNFYQAKNYLNPIYFRTFESLDYVRDHAQEGEYLAIAANVEQGLYDFYKDKYFSRLIPLRWQDIPFTRKQEKIWLFAVGEEGLSITSGAEYMVPTGYKILESFVSVPLDPIFKKVKEKILHRPSYIYKYSVFLLEKI